MSKLLKRTAVGLILLVILLGVHTSQAQTIQSPSLIMTGPSVCPPGGCASGQTLDFQVSFDLGAYDPAVLPNVSLCFYTPTSWTINSWRIDTTGAVTGATYQPDNSLCPPAPTGYSIAGGVSAQHAAGAFGDTLNLGFRIGTAAAGSGALLAQISQQSSSGWEITDQTFANISVIPTNTSVYVANDGAACSGFTPCYINSASDLPNGKGTGLKDAVDSLAATVTILGNYQVKSQTVLLDRAVTIQGLDDSRITYLGTTCSNPVLRVNSGVTLRDLTITDGSCTTTNRDLLAVDSAQNVLIEYVDLLNGLDALKIANNTGDVTMRFSQAINNSGYAVFRVPGSATGTVQVTGSNLYNNRTGAQADCGSAGVADHNFWGYGVSSSLSAAQCSTVEEKQLGAPVLPRSGAAGAIGERVTVTTTRQSSFNGLVSYQRTSEGANFVLNIVNHGAGSPENVPFTGGSPDSLVPCSNYYDVFLDRGAVTGGTLNLSLKYDRTAGCTTTIETSAYCTSTDPSRFPLYWYSPWPTAPSGWNTTGATGQGTTCNLTDNEITVAIDASGRPNFSTDLNFTPFVVGLPPQPSSVVLTHLEAIPGTGQATIQWTTSSEINTSGFYVLRSLIDTGGFERVSGFIARTGTGSGGANYNFVDTGLTDKVTYYYRLEIISTSLESSFSQVVSTTIGLPTNTATVTSTVTPSVTTTQTITPTGPTTTATVTRTPTITKTMTRTRLPTRTRTPIRYATYYIYRSPTPRPSRTLFPTRSATPTPTLSHAAETATAQVMSTLATQPTITGTLPALTLTAMGTPGEGEAEGYPPPEVTASLTATSTIESTLAPYPPDQSLNQGDGWVDKMLNFNSRYWQWILGLLLFELIVLFGVGFYLYKQHLLTFHFDQHEEEPPPPLD